MVYGCLPKAISSSTVKFFEATFSVNTTLISKANCCGVYVFIFLPFIRSSPDNFFCIAPRVRNKVDFPAPLIPITATSSPELVEKLIGAPICVCSFLVWYPILRF